MKLKRAIIAAQQSALGHVSRPPRLLFTSAHVHNVAASAYLYSSKCGDCGVPIQVNVVDPDLPAHTGGVIFDGDRFAVLFEEAAYLIPEGKTYLVKHIHNGVFTIVGEDGDALGGGVDEQDGTD